MRKKCGYTQNGLAERAGVSQTHLRRVELGQADITVGHLQLLCDAMSISLKEFFEGLEKISEKNNVRFYISINGDENNIPDFIQKYV